MATKGKDKILDGQIAFDFMGEIEKPKRKITTEKAAKEKIVKTKQVVPTIKKKKHKNIKLNHYKKSRKLRKIQARKF